MRLGSARLGSRSSRLGGGAAPAVPPAAGGIWIDYVLRLISRLAGYRIERAELAGVDSAAVASVGGATAASRISSAPSATIDDDSPAGRTAAQTAHIER